MIHLFLSYPFKRYEMCLLLIFAISMIISTEAEISEDFGRQINDLFRSEPMSRHSNMESFLHMHEKKITSLRNADEINTRQSFILRLPHDCGSRCHQQLISSFQAIDAAANYRIISHSHAMISTTMQVMDQVHQLHVEPAVLLEFAPLLAPVKLDTDVQAHIYGSAVFAESCYEYTISVSSLPFSEFQAFVAKWADVRVWFIQHEGITATFNFHAEDLAADRIGYARLEMFNKEGKCRADIDRYVLEAAAQMPEVTWIAILPAVVSLNRWARGNSQTGVANDEPIYLTANITGSGEVVGVADSGLDMMSCFFHDPYHDTPYNTANYAHRKVVYYSTQYGDGGDDAEGEEAHGTHVCGSVAGSPYTEFNYGDFPKYQGTAYNAKINFYDIQTTGSAGLHPPGDLNNLLLQPMYNTGARIMTNSWGVTDSASLSKYENFAVSVDQFMWSFPDALVFFAAGNSGGTAAGTARTITPPATNKNGVSVGASLADHKSWLAYTAGTASPILDLDSLAYFSSRGPTRDGRLKPDLTAPGFYTTSASGETSPTDVHCTLRGLSGTSMASPTAAGLAVIVRQYFTLGYYPSGSENSLDSFIPSGALMKAVLISASRRLSQVPTVVNNVATSYIPLNTYPDNNQGYGRIQLNNVLNFGKPSGSDPISLFVVGAAFSSSGHYVEIASNGARSYTFRTGSTVVPVRVTLTYTDYPGIESTTAANVIVNTLTLRVTAGGSTFTPYIEGQNVQVIDIDSPTTSTTYTVAVTAGTLSRTQPFALVITGNVQFLNSSSGSDIPTSASSSTATTRVKSLQGANVSNSAALYIGILAAVSFVLAVSSSYLYCKIRSKTKALNEADDDALMLGIQASIRDNERASINRNLRGDAHRE